MHFQQYIKRVREDTIRKWKWENAAAGFTCAAAAASSQRAEDPRHQVCLPAAPGRIHPPSPCFNYSVPPPSPYLWTFICTIHQFGDTALPCTDDSDCITLGWKYGCFLYRSIPFSSLNTLNAICDGFEWALCLTLPSTLVHTLSSSLHWF